MVKNEWIKNVLRDESFCAEATEKIDEDDYRSCLEGSINEMLFLEVLSRIKEERIAKFLVMYSTFAEAEEITPTVFQKLLSCKSSYKKSILIGLCHSNISFYQLYELSKLKLDEEAILQLIKRCIESNAFYGYDLCRLCEMGKIHYKELFIEDLTYLVDMIGIDNIVVEKQKALRRFLT